MSNPTKKRRVVWDQSEADKAWKILEHAIHDIYNHNNTTRLEFEGLYRNAYNMVLHKYGEKLYSGLVSTLTSHLKEISKSIESAQGDAFLEDLNRKWSDHKNALQKIRDIMMYMDRTFVPSSHKTPVYELGLNLWRDNVIYARNIHTRLLTTLVDLVEKERNGEVINKGLMTNMIKMLMDLYTSNHFENPFLLISPNPTYS